MADNGGGKNRKYGRNKVECGRYSQSGQRDKNKQRKIKRHALRMDRQTPNCGISLTDAGGPAHPRKPVRRQNYEHQAQARILKVCDNRMETGMLSAFKDALVRPAHNQRIGRIVVGVLTKHKNSGRLDMGKGWNASLTYSTYLRIRGVCGLS